MGSASIFAAWRRRSTTSSLLLQLLVLIIYASCVAADNPVVIKSSCDARMIPQGSAFWGHLGALLAQLVDNAPYTPSLSFKTRFGGADAPAFGQAHCSASCSPSQCHACLQQLSYDIWRICNSALSAQVEYPDCGIHYDCSYF